MTLDTLLTIIIFIIMLTTLVVVHELGHFFAARRAGIRVEEFGIGLPPKIWGRKFGETELTINALPVGGFVRMHGETGDSVSVDDTKDEAPPEKDRMFSAKSPLARTGVLVAGVVANLLLGMVLFAIVYTIGLPTFGVKPVIQDISDGSPAATAGLQRQDEVVAVNGTRLTDLDSTFTDVINDNKGREVTLTVNRDGQDQDIALTPRDNPPAGQGALGVTLGGEQYVAEVRQYPFPQSVWVGITEAIGLTGAIFVALGGMATAFFSSGQAPSDVSGPVGIASLLGQVRELGIAPVLWFAGILSINLAAINILPFPALDGGRLLFVIIEVITRRPVNQNVERWAHTIGITVLLALIALITFSDIRNLLR